MKPTPPKSIFPLRRKPTKFSKALKQSRICLPSFSKNGAFRENIYSPLFGQSQRWYYNLLVRYSPHCDLKQSAEPRPWWSCTPREECCGGPPSNKSSSSGQGAAEAVWRHHQWGLQQPPTTHRDPTCRGCQCFPFVPLLEKSHRYINSTGNAVFPAVNKCLNKSFFLGFSSLYPKTFCSDGNHFHCIFTDRTSEMPLRLFPELTKQSVSRTRNKTHVSSPTGAT